METQKNPKLAGIVSGIVSLLLILGIALGCVESGRTTQKVGFYNDNKGAKPADKVSPQTTVTEITGKVVGVSDGDTLTVLDADKKQHKIRLQGIDAPESGQPFGKAAKQNLSALVFGKTVRVVVYKRDRYNREVGTVYAGKTDVNLEQVKSGLAWHYKKYAGEQSDEERDDYASAERIARAMPKGLWSETNPIEPEQWRGGKRAETKTAETKTSKIPPTTVVTVDETEEVTQTNQKDLTVYITRTGEKYHRAGCRYLSRSQIPISLARARAGYGACSVCDPP